MAENTEITILHISDLHCGMTHEDPIIVKDRGKVIASFFASYRKILTGETANIYRPDAIVISGDIGWRGLENDYRVFKKKNGGFLDQLVDVTGVPKKNIFVCPGNHDKNVPTRYKKLNFRDDRENYIRDHKEEFTALFQNYSNAMKACGLIPYSTFNGTDDNGNNKIGESYLYGFRIVNIKEKNLCFIAQNTAWLCDYRKDQTRSSDKGQLSMGPLFVSQTVEYVKDLSVSGDSTPIDAVITLFHHPKEWLKRSELIHTEGSALAFERLVEKTNIFCHGHEHENYMDSYGQATVYAAGAIHSNDKRNSACNIIKLSFDDNYSLVKATQYPFKTDWDQVGKQVDWIISRGTEKELYNEQRKRMQEKEKAELSKLKEQHETDMIRRQVDEKKHNEDVRQIKQLTFWQRTAIFLCDADACISKGISIEDLKKEYVHDICEIAGYDAEFLNECYTNVDILHMQVRCSDRARKLCIAAFKGAMETLNKQNKAIDSPTRKLTLDSDDKAGGRDKT